MTITQEQLGLILQASRDFAVRMLGESGGFIPFATRVKTDGEIEFMRVADEVTGDGQLAEVFERTQAMLGDQARAGEILAAATVANVLLDEAQAGKDFEKAIQVHVEAPQFSRIELVPYRMPETDQIKQRRDVVIGEMIPGEADPAVFA